MNATAETERVDAAVAYATENSLIFDWCWDNKIPLRFWGRFDEQVPVAIPVLERFLGHRSGRYVCKLVRAFHPKVIWWHGYGAYIGSANLTNSAWYNNVEAGVFLTEDELVDGGHDLELEHFFRGIDRHAAPLTKELFDLLSQRNLELSRRRKVNKDADEKFLKTLLVPQWEGLANVNRKSASEQRKQAFLKEWNSTLQIMRDIAAKVSIDNNRPTWVQASAPLGAQADQFLHAHYYRNTFDGRRADYESHFARNNRDPDAALEKVIGWWRRLPLSNDEHIMLSKTAPALKTAFSENVLPKLTEDQFVRALSGIHASREYARRAPNRLIGLAAGQAYDRPQKLDALARRIFRAPDQGGVSAIETLRFVLYGGALDDLPQRLWEAVANDKLKVQLLGVSALGEIVGWALPDHFPPRNGRTSKALRSLGYDVAVHV